MYEQEQAAVKIQQYNVVDNKEKERESNKINQLRKASIQRGRMERRRKQERKKQRKKSQYNGRNNRNHKYLNTFKIHKMILVMEVSLKANKYDGIYANAGSRISK